MPDRFPEAFRRFEQQVNTRNIETFRQLTLAFERWAGRNWIPTYKQLDALAREARKRGIPTEDLSRKIPTGAMFQTARETRIAIFQQREAQQRRFSRKYLDLKHWQAKAKTARTTRYQQRIINYMKHHPEASLAEARGHRTKRS
jgi:hypothetical protein